MSQWIDQCHFGDCRELMPLMPAGVADACITDPPYGDTSLLWDKRCAGWVPIMARVLKPTASVWVFGSMRFLAALFHEMDAAGFRYAQDIVWEKQNGSSFHADRFRRVHEHAIHFYRGAWSDLFKEPQYTNDARAKVIRRKTRPPHTGHIDAGHYVSEDGGPRSGPIRMATRCKVSAFSPDGATKKTFIATSTQPFWSSRNGLSTGSDHDRHYQQARSKYDG